jgi:3D-(3,5/4)-trihydroxycyclohexane-1,2-dione acylhydrolase (decyclizing)
MKTVRLTMAQALVKYLIAQKTVIDRNEVQLFGGVYAIFGHGNVICLGEALEQVQDVMPTWRGQNEQSMGLAAVGYAKAMNRRQIMIAASSIGPGATNMVTAAGVALANRLPVLFLAGDTFASRIPDPVLQQVEHFGNQTTTVNDAFKPVTRYWDRITRPEQIVASLPQAVAAMLDPADCGPAFIGLSQDVQGEAFDYPEVFFEQRIHRIPRPRPDADQIREAASIIRKAKKPLIIAGGGVHYSGAQEALAAFAKRHNVPVAETTRGRTVLMHEDPFNVGVVGVTGASSANALAEETDVVIAIGTRLQDFVTGSWTAFGNVDMRLVSLNAARYDAVKHRAHSVVGDALVGIEELSEALAGWRGPDSWVKRGAKEYSSWNATIDKLSGPTNAEVPSYAQVIGAINRICDPTDLALTASGGLPGEINKNWRAKSIDSYDCEYGYSCMGYEIAGAWGAKMARPDRDVIALTGDGSYLMLNADIYSSVFAGHKLIVVVCDNGGFAVIDRLQVFKGNKSFNNLLVDSRHKEFVEVDFAKNAESMGAIAETVHSIGELESAFRRAKKADRTYVIVIKVQAHVWTPGDAWWETGVPEVSTRKQIRAARTDHEKGKAKQRIGV